MQELQSISANFPLTHDKWRSARAIKLRKFRQLAMSVADAPREALKFKDLEPRVEES
jgi:hypothetical protein